MQSVPALTLDALNQKPSRRKLIFSGVFFFFAVLIAFICAVLMLALPFYVVSALLHSL